MNSSEISAATMQDVSFALTGRTLPRDHSEALRTALVGEFPWLIDDTRSGVRAIKLVHGSGDPALLSGRVRLTLRVETQRIAELAARNSITLDIAGHPLKLGQFQAKELLAHGTLYAYQVAADSADENAFMSMINSALAAMGIACVPICGLHQQMVIAGRRQDTFSLMLHQLSPAHSLRLQEEGIGAHRLFGCGIFVPHRSAAPVGG